MTETTETTNPEQQQKTPPRADESPSGQLERALERQKERARQAEAGLKEANRQLAELRAERDRRELEWKEQQERTRQEISDEVLARLRPGLLSQAVQLASQGLVDDPQVVSRLLDLSQIEVSADGAIDQRQIRQAVEELVREHPSLARVVVSPLPGGGDRQPPPSVDMNALIRQAADRGRL